MDLVKNIDNLSIAEKISLYNCLYEDLAGKGTEGDTELAHVNKDEMAVLRAMGGSGTINPETNLIQFGGSSSPPPPTQQTVTQQSTFPEELQPFIKDIFGKAQAIQEQREEEGYTPFTGPRLADFTTDQKDAFEGIRGLVGASDPYFDRSKELVESSAVGPTSESIGALMNPYIQNVIDVEKREASRQADLSGQNLAGKAAAAGGFGGSREAILAAELGRNTQQQLGDIQTRGTAAAFEDAQRRFAEQKARESGAATNFMNLGTTAPAAARSELSALEAIGATQQGRGQQALDIAQQEFEIDRTFPERTLQDYSSILRGFTKPLPASTFTQSSTQAPGASFGQTASGIAGLGLTAANLFKPQGGFSFGNNSAGGLVGLANGGMVAKYQQGTGANTIGKYEPKYPDIMSIFGRGEDLSEEEKAKLKVEAMLKQATGGVGKKLPSPPVPQTPLSAPPQLESAPAQVAATEDPYGLRAYMAAKTKASEGKTKALDAQIEQEQSKKMQVLADKLLAYAGAPTDINEFQKLSQAFKGAGKELADIEEISAAAKVAKSNLDLENEKENIELTMKLKAIETKAAKAGLMSAKDLASLSEFARLNQDAAKRVRDNPKTDRVTRRILTDLISVVSDSSLKDSDKDREIGPTTPPEKLTRTIVGEKVN